MNGIYEFVGHINAKSFQDVLMKSEDGFVSFKNGSFDISPSESVWRKAMSSRGGDIYRRVRASQQRIISNADRPLGNTPVKGSGVYRYGLPRRRPAESGYSEQDLNYAERRSDLIRRDQEAAFAQFTEIHASSDTPVSELLSAWELHQVLTGGGYDNSRRFDTYTTAWRFVMEQEAALTLDSTQRAFVVKACESLRGHFEKSGMRLGSLRPTPYHLVRDDQSTDGVIGFPILEKSKLEFSEKVARAIRASYGIDLSHMIGTQVAEPLTDYVGVCRNVDAIAELIRQYEYDYATMAPLVTLFARIQRHGYTVTDDVLVPKSGKARAVFVPDVLYGGLGAMISNAFQREIMRAGLQDFPSLMNPEDQANTVMKLIDDAMANDFVCLSTDESRYDATLLNDVMATIMELVVKPFFAEEYWPMIDVCTMSLMCKVLVFPDTFMDTLDLPEGWNEDYTHPPLGVKNSYLVACVKGGLISGHGFTHIMGSLYGRIVCQKCFGYEMGYEVPPHILDGVMAGDDNVMLVPRALVDVNDVDAAYEDVSEVYAKYGLIVNAAKQIHIVHEGEPLTVFLQKAYHSGTRIKGIGSAARQLVAVNFSEHSPRFNKAQQWIAQISVMENGWNSPFIDDAVRSWLEQDHELTRLFQEGGYKAWDTLIEQAGTKEDIALVVNPYSHASFAYAQDPDDMLRGLGLKIIPTIVRVAGDVDVRHVDGGENQETDGGEALIL